MTQSTITDTDRLALEEYAFAKALFEADPATRAEVLRLCASPITESELNQALDTTFSRL